ncbi:hypothetical protein TB1_001426 [Malus domestica]
MVGQRSLQLPTYWSILLFGMSCSSVPQSRCTWFILYSLSSHLARLPMELMLDCSSALLGPPYGCLL